MLNIVNWLYFVFLKFNSKYFLDNEILFQKYQFNGYHVFVVNILIKIKHNIIQNPHRDQDYDKIN